MEIKETLRRIVLPVALTGALALSACGGDEQPTIDTGNAPGTEAPVTEDSVSDTDSSEVVVREEVCPEEFTTATPIVEEFSLSIVGGANSVLPNFHETTAVDSPLLSPTEVATKIMDRSCVAPTLLAAFDALYLQPGGFGEKGTIQYPDETLLAVLQARTDLFRENPEEALRTLGNLQSVILRERGFVYTDDFNVIANQAVILGPLRNEATTAAEQMQLTDITTGGTFEGWQVRFDLEDPTLSDAQRSTLQQISKLALITPTGEIIIKDWIGNTGSTSFEVVEDATTSTEVEPVISDTGDSVPTSPEDQAETPSAGNGADTGVGNNGNNGSTGLPGEGGECNGEKPTPNCKGTGPGPGGPGTPVTPEKPVTPVTPEVPTITAPWLPPTTAPNTTIPAPTTTLPPPPPPSTIPGKDGPSTPTTAPPPPQGGY